MEQVSACVPPLVIGDAVARVPIIQGGMGVGVSASGLASAVAREGGIGVIAGALIGLAESPEGGRTPEAGRDVLRRQVEAARAKSPGGLIGVNVLVALTDYPELCRTASEAGADFVFSGAGLPMALPAYAPNPRTKLVPIVSSGRAASLICTSWKRKHSRLPDALVVEGPRAGGHLGFSREQLDRIEDFPLEQLLRDVLEAVHPFELGAGRKIPVIAAGGIWDGADIAHMLRLGASGVQMATRFVGTHECDASPEFKQAFINCTPEDLIYVTSPVGMPGRAIRNSFMARAMAGEAVHRGSACPYHCLKTCDPVSKPYCIGIALNMARMGRVEQGLIFAGENASRVDRIVSVHDLIAELMDETRLALRSGDVEV